MTCDPSSTADARPRVLYIEDNALNALVVRALIDRRGDLQLEVCVCGLDGVRRAQQQPPALALVDMHLPDIGGLDVLARLRADPRTATVPCVALSADALPEDVARARDAGFADYWTKPLDFRQFSAGLEALFGPAPQP